MSRNAFENNEIDLPEEFREVADKITFIMPPAPSGQVYKTVTAADGSFAIYVEKEEQETFEVPLKMGIGGPVIGTAKIDADGNVYETTIIDADMKRKLQSPPFSMGLPDPADRYMWVDTYENQNINQYKNERDE